MIDTHPFTESLDASAPPGAPPPDAALDSACAEGDFDAAAVAAVAAVAGPGPGAPAGRGQAPRPSDAARG